MKNLMAASTALSATLSLALPMALSMLLAGSALADQQAAIPSLSAEASNPETMGWMQGFPAPEDKTIRASDQDAFAFPKLRWSICHFRELMPTVGVRNGGQGASALPYALDPAIDGLEFTPPGGDEPMTWEAAFDANYSDGLLVLHRGRIVYERYDGCLDETTLHGAMSITKSLTGLLGEVLVAEGRLDESAAIGELIPELKDSAFGDASLRQVLEMTTALDYSEDYADPEASVWAYARAGSALPPAGDSDGPRSYFEFLQTVEKDGRHGEAFGYKTVNADVLGWLIARTTGKSVSEYLADRIWTRLGAEREAFYTVDSIGTPFAGGGFNATLRDLGRFGLLVLNDGRWNDEQIIPPAAIARIREGGDRRAFATAGYDTLDGWSYRGMWWISHDDHGAFAARGVHGQTLWIDPVAEMVIVRFASNPVAANAANDPISLPAYRAVADYLMLQDSTPQLVGPEWLIEDIAGRGMIDNSPASLLFLPDGRLAGNATCNRIIGSYTHDGETLSIEPVGTTMMACPEALMNQERRLLDMLPQISGYTIDDSGALVLETTSGDTITARRT